MPNFNGYEQEGRMLMVKFTCQRCGHEELVPLESVDKNPESYGYLHNLEKPEGWEDLHIHGPLLCPSCVRAYVKFMQEGKRAK